MWLSILKSCRPKELVSLLTIVFTQSTSQDELACRPPRLLSHFFPPFLVLFTFWEQFLHKRRLSKISIPNPNLLPCARIKIQSRYYLIKLSLLITPIAPCIVAHVYTQVCLKIWGCVCERALLTPILVFCLCNPSVLDLLSLLSFRWVLCRKNFKFELKVRSLYFQSRFGPEWWRKVGEIKQRKLWHLRVPGTEVWKSWYPQER